MHRSCLTAIVALVAIAFVTTASAAEEPLLVEPGGSISSASSGKLTFAGGLASLRCDVTLEGTLEAVAIDLVGYDLGEIGAVRWAGCEGGQLTAALGLPWRLRYASTLGTLPESATGIVFTLQDLAMSAEVLGNRCLYEGDLTALLALSGSLPYETGSIELTGGTLSRVSGGFLCPATASLSGALDLAPVQRIQQPVELETTPDALIHTFTQFEVQTVRFTHFTNAERTVEIESAFLRPGRLHWFITDSCAGERLTIGRSCTVDVVYTPPADQDDWLELRSPAGVIVGRALMNASP